MVKRVIFVDKRVERLALALGEHFRMPQISLETWMEANGERYREIASIAVAELCPAATQSPD